MNKLFYALIITTLTQLFSTTAFAVTNGDLDGDDHPAVVLILMEIDGSPALRCSGVLIAPTFVLTAGHCANEKRFSGIRVFTESDVRNGNNNYPFSGPNAIEAIRWAAHPDFPNAPGRFNDVGVIELETPVNLPLEQYATLPVVNILDSLARQRGLQDVNFTAVGYGYQYINPVFIERELIRMFSKPHLVAINVPGITGDATMLLSNNHSTGGVCFGDSGGPNFIGDSLVVGGVTSFVRNGNCAGTGGVFRIDRQDVLDFINDFILN